MKSKFIVAVITAVFMVQGLYSQVHDHSQAVATKTKSDTIKVGGACGMCKTRIEKAAKIDGVTKASWFATDQKLIIVYNPTVTSSDAVQKKIAAVGHDTEKYKAEDKIYEDLPGCCQYER